MDSKLPAYHGNVNLKGIGYKHEFTVDQIEILQKCIADPKWFIANYCYIVTLDFGLKKFEMWPGQCDAVDLILQNKKSIIMMPRQLGKTVISAACILWYVLFHELKTVAIFSNQGAASREVLDRLQIMYENLPSWMQQGIITWNKGDIELENGSKVITATTTTSSKRGRSINWLYIDEAAIIPNNLADKFFASVLPTISSGQTSKILITSTPLGFNHFWKYWNEAAPITDEIHDTYYCDSTPGKNGFVRKFVPYWECPGRDDVWALEQQNTLGELRYAQEIECNFMGSSNTLLNGVTLQNLSSMPPIFSSEDTFTDIYEYPLKGRNYVMTADVARGVGGDYSAFTIFDITEFPYKTVAKYRNNRIAPMLFPQVIWKTAKEYNDAWILVESNDIGGQIVDILYSELEYEHVFSTVSENGKALITPGFAKQTLLGVRQTKTTKRIGCFALKSLMEEKKLLCFDADTIAELSYFVEHNGSFQADSGAGHNDDMVMTLVLFAWLTTNQYFKEMTDVNVRERIYKQQMEQIDSELVPFGAIKRATDPEPITVVDNLVWSADATIPWIEEVQGWSGQ